MSVLRDSEINFVIKTTTSGDDAYDKTAAKMDAVRDKAVVTSAEMDALAESQKVVQREVGKAGSSFDSQRSALQRMTQDYKDAKLVSEALGGAIGVSGAEFEKLANEAINAGEGLGGSGGGFSKGAKAAGDAAGGASASIAGITFDLQLLLEVIGAVVVAMAPLVAVFISWLVVTTAIGVAMAGMLAVFAIGTAGIVALGVAVGLLAEHYFQNAQTAAQNLQKAQTALTTATNAHNTAVRQLQTAEAAVTAGRAPTVSQLNAIANAHQQVTTTTAQLTTAQNNLHAAQLNAAHSAQGLVDPLQTLKDHLASVANVLGAEAYPMFIQIAQAADQLVEPIKNAGETLLTWFGSRLPQILQIAGEFATIFGEAFKKLGPIFFEVMDFVILHAPEFELFFTWLLQNGVPAVQGLVTNLEKLSDWFFSNFGSMTRIAGDGFDAIGVAIQAVAATWGSWAEWIRDHWPQITAIAQQYIAIIGKAFSLLGEGVHTVLPLIMGAIQQFLPVWAAFLDQLKQLGVNSSGMQEAVKLLGVAIGILIVLVIAAAIGILGMVVAFMQVVSWISQFVGWITDHFVPAINTFMAINKQANELVPNLWNTMVNGVIDAISKFMSWMVQLAAFVIVKLTEIDQNVLSFLTSVLNTIIRIGGRIFDFWVSIWNAIFTVLANVLARVLSVVQGYWNVIFTITQAFLDLLQGNWSGAWNALVGLVGNALANVHNTANNWMGAIYGMMINWASTTRDNVAGIFGAIAGAVGGAMSVVGGVIHGDLEQARGIVDGFIHAANKALSINIGDVPEFAGGGVLPGYMPGHDTVMARLSPGEGVLTPQAVRMVGADTVHAINNSAKGFADGGIVGALLGGAQNAAGSALGGLGGFAGSVAQGAGHLVLQGLLNWLGDHIGTLLSNVGGGGGGGGGAPAGGPQLMAWILAAIAATGVPANWAAPLSVLIMRESGGNPRAINLSDSNAAMGDPSRGLAQTIGSTFEAYRLGSLPDDIYDPVANIAAAIKYIQSRYGDISNVQQANASLPPKGYDSGGTLKPGTTLAVNRTGKDEFVMTQEQLTAGQHLHFHTVGKPDDEFIRQAAVALDWQRRTGRIP